MTTLVDKIEARAKRIRGYIASSQRVVELLAPEQAKFDAREAPWDTYTVRMSVDHMSSIRTQTKEAEELEAVVIALRERDQAVEALKNQPKHRFWGAGEPDCPREIKAGNGELHTLRCKVCGEDSPRNPVCLAAIEGIANAS